MRILKVMPFFSPATRFGGVVSQAVLLCTELARRGHELSVITTDNGVSPDWPRDRWLEREGYRVYYAHTRFWHRCPPYYTPTIRPALRERLPDTDILCANVGLTLMNRLAATLAGRYGVPFVYNAEGALCSYRLGIKKYRKKLFLELVERTLLRRAAAIQAVTEKERVNAITFGAPPERVHVVPNGIAPPAPITRENHFRSRLGIPPDAPVVLFLGRMHRIKGLPLLVDSFSGTGDEKAHLVIAGPDEDGSGRHALARGRAAGLGDRMHLIGLLENEDRARLLSEVDLFALTSHSEGLPNAILEALSYGIPCLLSENCNVPEVEEEGAGFVRPLDPGLLASALRRQLDEPALRTRQAAAARRLARSRFSLQKIVSRLEEIYGQVARDCRQ